MNMKIYFKEKSMKTLTAFTLILMVMAGGQNALAQNFAAPYLQFSNSAVGAAFGNAYTSLSDDASATYWNPAGLAAVKSYSFSGMASAGLGLDRNFNTASIAFNLKKQGVVALSITSSGVDNIQGYDENGVRTNTFNVVNLVPGISYAFSVAPELSIGSTLRYIRQNLDVQVDNGYSFDFGVRYEIAMGTNPLVVSAIMQNLVGNVGVNALPKVLRMGIGSKFRLFEFELDYVVEDLTNAKSKRGFNFGLGYELNLKGLILSAQTGFQNVLGGQQNGFQNDQNLTAGAGIGMNFGSMFFKFDYAYVSEPTQIFSNSHRLGVTISGK
jgi:long-subunit fatty acid transport protein